MASFAAALVLLVPLSGFAKDPSLRDLQKRFARAQAGGDLDEASRALADMGEIDDKKVGKFLLGFAIKTEDPILFAGAKDGLSRIVNEKSIKDLAKLLEKNKSEKGWEARALVAEAFRTVEGEVAANAILKAVTDPNAVVRREAAHALSEKPSGASVKALAQMYADLEEQKGRTFMTVRRSLIELTGFHYATGEEWLGFAKTRADEFDFENDRGEEGDGGSIVKRPTFFGSEIESTQVVFIVDTSGSMEMWDENSEFPEDKYKTGRPPESRVRMKRTQEELKKTLRKLGPTTRFNIIGFSSAIRRWQKDLVPADKKNIEDALAFVDRLQADGGTYTDLALKEAFKYEDVDAIYLLSDGSPIKFGEEKLDTRYRGEILGDTWGWNRYRKVQIHTMGFAGDGVWPKHLGPRPSSLKKGNSSVLIQFLTDLATQNFGTFVPVP
ncbi:MAG: VWA domain-containing protein [Planctomycetota bacterium]